MLGLLVLDKQIGKKARQQENLIILLFATDIPPIKQEWNVMTSNKLRNNIFFIQNGYLHVKNLISEQDCDSLRNKFLSDVKCCQLPKLRQRSVTYETHRFSTYGFVENALLDIHRIDIFNFPEFVDSAFNILINESLTSHLNQLIGDDSILLQTMYFEGSRGTIAHFDKFFLGTSHDNKDALIGIWIALEDIHNSAGRFFIYPQSNQIIFDEKNNNHELTKLLEKYKECNTIAIDGHKKNNKKHHIRALIESKRIINKIIEHKNLKRKYPTMKKGDVLFFSSSTLHGSDAPDKSSFSRNSLTAHFSSSKLKNIQYGSITEPLNCIIRKGLKMHISNRYQHKNKIP